MTHQIERFPPHQNAKVFAVLMTVSSLIFLVPMLGFSYITAPPQARAQLWLFSIMPVIYLIFGYITVAIGCLVYNVLFPYIGGIKFISRSDAS